MQIFDIIAILLVLTAVFGYINARVNRLPTTIGVMLIALVFSLILIGLARVYPPLDDAARAFMGQIDFNKTVMHFMLCYLLFAGALHVDLGDLGKQGRVISIMATIGVLISTFLIGGGFWLLAGAFGYEIRFIYCLLLGALISPTDPVAVLGVLKRAGAPKSLETKIAGESLFNDGVGVVVFVALLGIAGLGHGAHPPEGAGDIAALFAWEAVGGIILGLLLGLVAYAMLKSIENYQIEVLITLALVTGGYALALKLHTSGPLAMVVAGLFIGNRGRSFAMSEKTREHLDQFWELADEILNALLFVLIGLEVLVLDLGAQALLIGLCVIPLVLFARLGAVSVSVGVLRPIRTFTRGVIPILTWAGLRGGISVALALSLPADGLGETRDLFVVVTYVVVVFSIAVQGLTLRPVIQRCAGLKHA